MGYNPASIAYHFGTAPWMPGYIGSYAVSFYWTPTGHATARCIWHRNEGQPERMISKSG